MSLYLSRVRLRNTPDVGGLARILLPEEGNARVLAGHRLVWSLFADAPDRPRDFLWREDGGGTWRVATFLILSTRPPEDRNGLFDIDEPKRFAPVLAVGQRLGFRLRASPSANEPRPHGERGKRIDPLAKALKALSKAERAEHRHDVTQKIASTWLTRQGAGSGFRLAEVADEAGRPRARLNAEGDHWRVLRREAGDKPIRFSTLDLEGELIVEDPALFLAALARGFGRAKAFGCGLMLIRRS